ncbi:MAG: hypothetical protein QOK66_03720 [Nitrososphaeraceae archaeon]|nr:hypothetical protein [Nitrososphaeraceae archaeon]
MDPSVRPSKEKVKVHPVANCNAALPFPPPDIDPTKMTGLKKAVVRTTITPNIQGSRNG